MKYSDRPKNWIYTIVLLSVFIILGACASTPQTPQLDQARAAFNAAESDSTVTTYSPVALHEAKKSLDLAEAADEQEDRVHYAYLAQRQTEIAVTQADLQKTEKEVQVLRQQRQDILLKKRDMEIQVARQDAQAAQSQVAGLEKEKAGLEMDKFGLEKDMAVLAKELEGLQPKQTDRGLMVTMGGVLFKTNEASLMPGAMRTIDQISQFLANHPEYRASIEGHTDSVGSAEYNQQLSVRRAESVSIAIQGRGITSDRLLVKGLGEYYPLANNDTAAGRQQNRRVEIVFLQK